MIRFISVGCCGRPHLIHICTVHIFVSCPPNSIPRIPFLYRVPRIPPRSRGMFYDSLKKFKSIMIKGVLKYFNLFKSKVVSWTPMSMLSFICFDFFQLLSFTVFPIHKAICVTATNYAPSCTW